jgi:hypothetical protein
MLLQRPVTITADAEPEEADECDAITVVVDGVERTYCRLSCPDCIFTAFSRSPDEPEKPQ